MSQSLPLLGDLGDKRLLTLGVQDCYFTFDQLSRFLTRHRIPHRALAPGEVLQTTGFRHVPEAARAGYADFVHQKTLFRMLGFEPGNIVSLDFSGYEGADITHDLNEPVPGELHGRFDLVLDGGTIEHVLSLKDSLFNISRLCRVGGVVMHLSPVDYINHGFFNVNADLFRSYYRANGFEELALKYVAIPNHPRRAESHYLEFEPDRLPFSLQPYYSILLHGVYRKTRDQTPNVPQQGFYEEAWGERKTPGEHPPSLQWLRTWAKGSFLGTELLLPMLVRRRGRKVRL